MSNTETENPHSWLRTDRFTPINSSWLAENLKGVDQSVQDLLTLIEDSDYSLADADLVHLRRSDMFDHIKQIYHKHQTLAEQYDQILSSDYSSLAITDDHANGIALTTPNQDCQNHQFDNASFPSNLSDGSSKIKFSLSESDSESDSSIEKYETPIMMPYPKNNNNGSSRNDEYTTVLNKITKYKEELKATQHKLQVSEEEVAELKRNESMAMSELEEEKRTADVLRCQISDCNMNVFKLVTELSYLREEVVKANDELSNAREGFEVEKAKLEMEVLELSEVVFKLEERNQMMDLEGEYLRSEARESMRSKKWAEEEVAGKVRMIEDLYKKVEANEEKMKWVMKRREEDEKRIGELEEKVERSREGEEELKKEVVDRGEEKKEAIRQLCFSLDYYRNRNEKLRQVIVDANSKCCYYYKPTALSSAS